MNLLGTVLGLVIALTPPTVTSKAEVKRVYPEISPCAIVSEQEVRADYQIVDENGVTTYQTNRVTPNDRSIPTRPYSNSNVNTTQPNSSTPNVTRNGSYVRGSVNGNNSEVVRNSNVTYKNGSSNNNATNVKNANTTYQNDNYNNSSNVARNKPRTLNLVERDYASMNLNNESNFRNEIASYHNEIAQHKSEIDILRAKCRAKVREYEESLYKKSAQTSYSQSNYYYDNVVR